MLIIFITYGDIVRLIADRTGIRGRGSGGALGCRIFIF